MIRILTLGVLSQFCLVAGNLWVKHAMNTTNLSPVPWGKMISRFVLGIVFLSGWFFLWVGLLQRKDLSYIYPLEGLSFVLVILGARVLLKELIPSRAWLGVGLITLGVALVSAS